MSPRRIRWVVRLVVLALLAVLAAGAFALRAGAGAGEDRFLTGTTAQDTAFEMQTSRSGVVYGFTTDVYTRCPNGVSRPVRWFPPASAALYRRDGERLIVRERWRNELPRNTVERGWARLEGTVAGDGGQASGAIDMETRFERDGVDLGSCRARGVRWRASD